MASPRAAANRRYYERHREAVLERTRAYTAAHPDEQRAASLRHYHRNRDQVQAYREANRDHIREQGAEYYRRRGQFVIRMREYGLTQEQYEAMLESQGRACVICGLAFGDNKTTAPHVDHDHATGRVRALLCINCNFLVGYCREDSEVLTSAARYLVAQKEV